MPCDTVQVVNCSFDQSMDVKELTSLAKQIQLAYTQVSLLWEGNSAQNSVNLCKQYSGDVLFLSFCWTFLVAVCVVGRRFCSF